MSKRVFQRVVVAAALAAPAAVPATSAAAPVFPFQPIQIQRIGLPHGIKSAAWPVFTHDGSHVLFFSTATNTSGGSTGRGATVELWITGLNGKGQHCLTCGLANDPTSTGEGEVTPFSDGKRVFFGSFKQPGSSSYGVLECSPSVVDCRQARILPVDFSAADPASIPAGGIETHAEANLGGDYAAKLAQDDVHVGWSDIRADSVEMMLVGTLTRSPAKYVVTGSRVINPASPSSAADSNAATWSASGALYEFKTFTHGGADATYVEGGGLQLGNPDVWQANLKTGRRTRLTANPDYDEDNAGSPDGSLLALWSNRTMHMTDWYGGLLPVRGFIDEPASLIALSISSSNKRCHGPIWVLPASGDRGARVAGQPIVDYATPHVFVTNNLTGWPQWSPNGTMLALNTTNNRPGGAYPAHAPFLLVAHFSARSATKPLRAVSSSPGSWAVAPTAYHTVFGFAGSKVFRGARSGTVIVNYGLGGGVLTGAWSETYNHYSDDGRSFVSGTVSVDETGQASGTYTAHLTMTGAHTGTTNVEFTSGGAMHGSSTLDGHTVSGPSAEQAAQGACPAIQPKEPALRITATRLARGVYRVKVTASMAAMGANEASTDTEPVDHALLHLGRVTTATGTNGTARVRVTGTQKLTVTAGDTLKPSSLVLRG